MEPLDYFVLYSYACSCYLKSHNYQLNSYWSILNICFRKRILKSPSSQDNGSFKVQL